MKHLYLLKQENINADLIIHFLKNNLKNHRNIKNLHTKSLKAKTTHKIFKSKNNNQVLYTVTDKLNLSFKTFFCYKSHHTGQRKI